MKRLYLIICMLPFLCISCKSNIVVNNAFVYLVHDSCFSYGIIEGEQWQSVLVGNHTSLVTAKPYSGYAFVKWSDGLLNVSRTDFATSDNSYGPLIYYAIFEAVL